MLIRAYRLLILIIEVAYGSDVEELVVIFEIDPEATVVFSLKFRHLFTSETVPLPRIVAPVAVPLFLAPRVPD
jgi:hypothetical protein